MQTLKTPAVEQQGMISRRSALLAAVGLVLIKGGPVPRWDEGVSHLNWDRQRSGLWVTIHTVFTLRYTRSHYPGFRRRSRFRQKDPPAYLDFEYLAFTIGMTFQVSDTTT